MVIKADNLAAGKGVYICKDKKESYTAVKEIFDGKFGVAKHILFEEFLEGEEMSYFMSVMEKHLNILAPLKIIKELEKVMRVKYWRNGRILTIKTF